MNTEQFKSEYLQFEPELKSYLLKILGHRQDAEDLSQEVFIKAWNKINLFQGKSNIKTWVFSIATNLARDHFRISNRWANRSTGQGER